MVDLGEIDNIFESDPIDSMFLTLCGKNVLDNMYILEKKRPEYVDYLRFNKNLDDKCRSIVIDWIVDICDELRLSSQTLYLTITYLDRYLSKKCVTKGRFQLIATTCLWIAAKFEEIRSPRIDILIQYCNSVYSKYDFINAEYCILRTLDYTLLTATSRDFLRIYQKASGENLRVIMLANYLCELALIEYSFLKYKPSIVAASSVYLARLTLKKAVIWNNILEHYSGYTIKHIKFRECIKHLHLAHMVAHEFGEFTSISIKYSRACVGKVSFLEPINSITQLFPE